MIIDRGLDSPPVGARHARGLIFGALLASLLSGCVFLQPPDLDATPLEAGRLPAPDTIVELAQLGPCTDAPERALSLDSSKPVTVHHEPSRSPPPGLP